MDARAIVGSSRREDRAIELVDLALEVSMLAGESSLQHVDDRVRGIDAADLFDPLPCDLRFRNIARMKADHRLRVHERSRRIGLRLRECSRDLDDLGETSLGPEERLEMIENGLEGRICAPRFDEG